MEETWEWHWVDKTLHHHWQPDTYKHSPPIYPPPPLPPSPPPSLPVTGISHGTALGDSRNEETLGKVMMGLDILDELLEAVMLWMWMMWCYCLCPECSHIPYSVLLSTGALLSMVKSSALNRESVLTWDKAYVCVNIMSPLTKSRLCCSRWVTLIHCPLCTNPYLGYQIRRIVFPCGNKPGLFCWVL